MDDLGLSEDQMNALETARTNTKDKIDQEFKKLARPGVAAARAVPVPVPGGGVARVIASSSSGANPVIAELLTDFDKTTVGLLNPDPTRRLRQIAVQIQGPQALLDRRVIRALELTAEQEDQIDA